MAILRECRNRPSVVVAKQFFGDLLVNPDSTQEEMSLILLDDPDKNDCVSPEKQKEILNTWGSDILDKEREYPESANLVFSIPPQPEPADHTNTDGVNSFDAIRHHDPDGEEYWKASELEEVLGVLRSEFFLHGDYKGSITPLTRALKLCEITLRVPVTTHFTSDPVERVKGRNYSGWTMTAMGCYLVFAQCDFSDPKILEAQRYFGDLVGLEYGENISPKYLWGGCPAYEWKTTSHQSNSKLFKTLDDLKQTFDAILRYDKNGVQFWTARDLMDILDIDCFGFFEDTHDSLISNAIAECQDCGIKADSEFHKKYLDWDLSYMACHFIFKRFNNLAFPKVREAQDYFGCFGEVDLNAGNDSNLVTIYFEPPEVMPKHKQPGVVFTSKQKQQLYALPTKEINPFDAIRHNYPNGMEFWKARELMKLLKIRGFGMFKDNIPNSTISQAMAQYEAESLECEKMDIKYHFCKKEKDWELSAFACYLIFIRVNRVTYPEVEKAVQYFAREVGRPINPDLGVKLKIVHSDFSPSDTPLLPEKNKESEKNNSDSISPKDSQTENQSLNMQPVIEPFEKVMRYDKVSYIYYWLWSDLVKVVQSFNLNQKYNFLKAVQLTAISYRKACEEAGQIEEVVNTEGQQDWLLAYRGAGRFLKFLQLPESYTSFFRENAKRFYGYSLLIESFVARFRSDCEVASSVDAVTEQEESALAKKKSTPFPREESISPFDAIRRYDKDGNEYWSARELMEFMGYDTWRRFENPIEEAIENIELTGEIAENHIAASDKVVHRPQGGGSTLSDYKLSRHGCYMIAICCDRRKPEVAMAKRYFTRATRENELRKQREADEGKLKISDEEALKMAMECLEISGVAQPVVSQFKMRQLAKLDPAHKEIYEGVCGHLASAYTLENKPILVTKVGQMICDRLGLNRNIISFAKTVNQKLIEIGLQEKDIKYKEGKPYNKGYVLTEKGEPWAIVENPTDSEGRVRPQISKYICWLYLWYRLNLPHPCCVRLGQEWVRWF